jgi:tRNA(adenine34) deaminase
MKEHEKWMQHALKLAEQAALQGEVPVGAVVVLNDEIIGEGFNQPISTSDPTAHAEIVALRNAAKKIGNYRLNEATLYVTIEPCLMCAGSLVHARIKKVVFGASEPKAGAVISAHNVLDNTKLNHMVEYQGGVLAEQCSQIISDFFKNKRVNQS